MPPASASSSSLLFLLLLLLPLLWRGGAAEDAVCGGGFRAGQEDFVLDVEDAVTEGAVLLLTALVADAGACERACCNEQKCNLALLEPPGAAAGGGRSCVLFNCVHRSRFVCRFVNKVGYLNYIRESVYLKYLEGPQGAGEQAPPIANAGRDVVVQPRVTVTLNGIESLPLGNAHITDYHWSLLSGHASVKMEETDLPDQLQLSNLQPGSYVFQLTVTDSNDQSQAAKVTVLVVNPEQSSLYCLAPMKVGPCRAAFLRWRYDAEKGDCQQFVFGGCKANNNNYLSDKECLTACSGVTATSGAASSVTSERAAVLPTGEVCGSVCGVDQLICRNGCCLDRSLECDGVAQCSDASDEEHCSKLNQTFNRLLDIDVNQRKARCTEPPRTGPCRASHSRWYYDPLNTNCNRFTFGGCDGNENNFEDEARCITTCEGVTEEHVFARGIFERFEEVNDSDSGSITLAVVLSVAILALLAILAYCFLKKRKERSHQPVPTGPAHVALSEQDTLVYNSTTKPV
ncbi:kunitz-type protease inhibitor 1-like [Aulostomus maculatus]